MTPCIIYWYTCCSPGGSCIWGDQNHLLGLRPIRSSTPLNDCGTSAPSEVVDCSFTGLPTTSRLWRHEVGQMCVGGYGTGQNSLVCGLPVNHDLYSYNGMTVVSCVDLEGCPVTSLINIRTRTIDGERDNTHHL